jgi:hypothetical protein
MPVLYRERPRNRTRFESSISSGFAWMNATDSAGNNGHEALSVAELAVSPRARKIVTHHYRALRVGKLRSIKPVNDKPSVEVLLQQVDDVTASNPLVLRRVVARNGTVYPLRTEITVVVKHAVRTAEAFVYELRCLESLFGKGSSDESAVGAFSESFHHLVMAHHRKPPHLHTDEDRRINRVLDYLIDWEQFEVESPIEQPLWGRVIKRVAEGNLSVYWVCGPCGESAAESILPASNVIDDFARIEEGHWFYGSGRVFRNSIEWTSRPVEVPDPHDETAARAAWDLIPSQVITDPAAWPLTKGN